MIVLAKEVIKKVKSDMVKITAISNLVSFDLYFQLVSQKIL